MGLFSKDKPKPPARIEEKPAPAPQQPVKNPPPSLGNTIDAIKKRKKMLDEI
jgi:hypothetical protein